MILNVVWKSIIGWFNYEKLWLTFVLFCRRYHLSQKAQLPVTADAKEFEIVGLYKYVWTKLDQCLFFHDNVTCIHSKTSSHIWVLERARHVSLTIENNNTIYFNIVILSLTSSHNDKEVLRKFQNCAVKRIFKVDPRTRTTNAHEELVLEALQLRRKTQTVTEKYLR